MLLFFYIYQVYMILQFIRISKVSSMKVTFWLPKWKLIKKSLGMHKFHSISIAYWSIKPLYFYYIFLVKLSVRFLSIFLGYYLPPGNNRTSLIIFISKLKILLNQWATVTSRAVGLNRVSREAENLCGVGSRFFLRRTSFSSNLNFLIEIFDFYNYIKNFLIIIR